MSMISLGEAATRLGLSPEAIEEWAQKGLLHVHTVGMVVKEQQVDEEELAEIAESLGWLQLSAEGWDDDEGE
jgi:hypothetical protein